MATERAAEQVRRNALTQKPEDYKAELPKDFVVPPGLEYKFNEADPLMPAARQIMLDIEHGRLGGQEAFSKLLGLYASGQVSEQQMIAKAQAAQLEKLGPNATVRIDSLTTWLNGMVGPDGAKELSKMLITEGIVRNFEKLITKHSSQGAAGFSQAGRVPENGGRVSEEAYQKMSAAERLTYVRQFDQKQFQNGART